MSRGLSMLALLVLLIALGAAQAKISLDTTAAHVALGSGAGPGTAPLPSTPSGLDGRPLDAKISINPSKGKGPPKGGPPGKSPPHGRR
ncbi:MAG: hypothetical protein ACI8RZ_005297 [Myxococcota bacterium]|jgi:hypothetical protein